MRKTLIMIYINQRNKMKNKWLKYLVILSSMLILCSGCGAQEIDYTDYFSIDEIIPTMDEDENFIEVNYTIENLGKRDDLTFIISIDGETSNLSVEPQASESGKMVIDIGHPNEYELSYDVKYEVEKNGESIWNKEETLTYDCTEMFNHSVTINYGGESTKLDLIDYQVNCFDLTELFDDFNEEQAHSITLANAVHDIARIKENKNDETGQSTMAKGSFLIISTYGILEASDTWHYTDGLIVNIVDSVTAASVNWEEHIKVNDMAERSSVAGIELLVMSIEVDNVSEEDLKGYVTNVYVNDSPISSDYIFSDNEYHLWKGKVGSIKYSASSVALRSANVENVEKLGFEIRIIDSNEEEVYTGTVWLGLE